MILIDCPSSATDNPLIDPDTGIVHHGGNFQAMAVTAVLEPLRLSLFHIAKLLFSQATELQNPLMSNGLPGNLAATDPSLNFFGKGIDIGMASYVAELAHLAQPVSTGVQSAEMHNQAVNSMALVSARRTLEAIEVVGIVAASYIVLLCQAVDLRAMQNRMEERTGEAVKELLKTHFGFASSGVEQEVTKAVWGAWDTSASMDAGARAEKAAKASTTALVEHILSLSASDASAATTALATLPSFVSALSASLREAYTSLQSSFLLSSSSPSSPDYLPALPLLGRTKHLYEFVRAPVSAGGLGVCMHGRENLNSFKDGLSWGTWEDEDSAEEGVRGRKGRTIGGDVGVVFEAIRDGRMRGVLVSMFEEGN